MQKYFEHHPFPLKMMDNDQSTILNNYNNKEGWESVKENKSLRNSSYRNYINKHVDLGLDSRTCELH